MIEIAITAVGSGVAAYGLANWLHEDTEGCNGHHWGEKKRIDAEGVSSAQRHEAGLKESYIHSPQYAIKSNAAFGRVELYTTAIERCKDCGEYRTSEVSIGTMDFSSFEDDS